VSGLVVRGPDHSVWMTVAGDEVAVVEDSDMIAAALWS
jgi:hypothetical protein